MEINVTATEEILELSHPMPIGRRVLFLLLALFPLLAPYELVFRIPWKEYFNLFFIFAAVISAGAVALSGLLVFAAIGGLNSRMKFDKPRGMLFFTYGAPILPQRTEEHPFATIADLAVRTHDWSDGAPSFSFEVVLRDGKKLHLGSSWSRMEVEEVRNKAAVFLGRKLSS